MRRNLWLLCALGLMAGLPLVADAGERKVALILIHARSGGRPAAETGARTGATAEHSFATVSPMGIKAAVRLQSDTAADRAQSAADKASERKEHGPSTAPSERKTLTFFRLNPKLGDVSVQPVVGGVNGAQLSVGF